MVKTYDVDQTELVNQVASVLKVDENMKMPDWALYVKTGSNKERVPLNQEWWYYRAASILRKVYLQGPIGVSKLRTKYGSKKNRGVKPEKFVKSSGKVIRIILQQLESAQYIKKVEKSLNKGRIIAPKGMSLLDKVAGKLYKEPVREIKQESLGDEESEKATKEEKQEPVKEEKSPKAVKEEKQEKTQKKEKQEKSAK